MDQIPPECYKVFASLDSIGCCERCCLRFMGKYENNEHLTKDPDLCKKTRKNPCVLCLDLLSDRVLDDLSTRNEFSEVKEYDSKTFTNFISFPASILLREHNVQLFLKEKFPDWLKDRAVNPINKVWSELMQTRLSKILNKSFSKSSNFHIQLNVKYDADEEETAFLVTMFKEYKLGKKQCQSRNFIMDFLKSDDAGMINKHLSVPPNIPNSSVVFDSISFKHEAVYLGGRYCKFSRKLGQTPWVIDDVRIMENSVQEIIFQSLEEHFNCKMFVFSASGREDFDVRMLGSGRPFFIKLCDSKTTSLVEEKFRLIEENIKTTGLVTVTHLQFIDKSFVDLIKQGEQFKKKTYRALCIVKKPEMLDDNILKINELKTVTLMQKTPLRVLHRRSADVRMKTIYEMEARKIQGENLFEIDLVTQAGTYVKEFIHGDLGRTKPSLGDIIEDFVDIIALDVLDIDLDFPPKP